MSQISPFLSLGGEDGYTVGVGETCSRVFIFINFPETEHESWYNLEYDFLSFIVYPFYKVSYCH